MKKQTKLGLVLAAAAVISVSVASLVSARGWVQQGADWYYVDNNNEFVTDTIQSSGNSKFYLGEDGAMMRDYFLEEYGDNNNAYYFGQNGAMVTNTWVAIESSRVENQEDYIPDNYWYYFQASGKAMKAGAGSIKKTTIDGKKYAFNEHGQMLTGWIGPDGKVLDPESETNPFAAALYYAGGDNDGVLRAGWVTYYDGYDGDGNLPENEYTNLYFYFNTSNNKMYGKDSEGNGHAETKKINGKTYAFSNEGVMLSGWDAWVDHRVVNGEAKYFSGEDDGHQVKKGWVYAVPAETIDKSKYDDDEEQYMYFNASGDIVKDQFKKINGKFYVFSRTGIMKTGVIIWCPDGVTGQTDEYKYVDKLDLDYAEGADVSKKGKLHTGYKNQNPSWLYVDHEGKVIGNVNNTLASNGDKVKLHLYGSDGARKTGANSVEFSDDTYVLQTSGNLGDKGSGYFGKKYYSLGIQLKASADLRYGIYTSASPSDNSARNVPGGRLRPQSNNGERGQVWYDALNSGDYQVLTTGGARVKQNANGKKDADGNYWLIGQGDVLKGIWTQNVSWKKSFSTTWRTRKIQAEGSGCRNTATYAFAKLVDLGLAIQDANPVIEDATISWRANINNDGELWFTPTIALQDIYAFQSDYDGGANKWIPMGLTDDAKNTCTTPAQCAANAVNNAKAHQYEVKPTDEYFLNCYWIYKED